MKDTFGREIDYLRISVTDRCNLRCRYCMPEEGVESISHDRILRFSEILSVVEEAAALGITKLKITGGEPLVRKGIPSLLRDCRKVPGIRQLTMTTNGVLLREMYNELAEAGLDALTVSLDTMNREEYFRLTRRDELPEVLAGLDLAWKRGRIPLKINCVSYKRSTPEELVNIALLARDHPVHVRFIEMMPIGLGRQFEYLSEEQLKEILEPEIGALTPYRGRLGNGPAVYYTAEGFAGKIGFISAMSHRFCGSCNRLRLTSSGYLKSCLQYDTGVDLRLALASGSREKLRDALIEGIRIKPQHHSFGENGKILREEQLGMSQIGG